MPPKPKHINRFLAFCVFLICSQFSIGQNIELQTIASGGGLLKTPNSSLSSTSGQTIIATTSANKNTLTQGFQQIDCDLNPEIFAIKGVNHSILLSTIQIQGGKIRAVWQDEKMMQTYIGYTPRNHREALIKWQPLHHQPIFMI